VPSIFYTKDEVDALIADISNRPTFKIIELTAGTATPENFTPIPSQPGVTTIALVTTTAANFYVSLTSDSGTIGDLVEIHNKGDVYATEIAVLFQPGPPGSGAYDEVGISGASALSFRKITETVWHPLHRNRNL